MHHRVEASRGEQAIEQRRVGDGAARELARRQRAAGRKIVEHSDRMTRAEQCPHGMAADVARSARDENSRAHARDSTATRVPVAMRPILKKCEPLETEHVTSACINY